MNRRSDKVRPQNFRERATGRLRRKFIKQNEYSLVSALLSMVLTLTLLVDLLVGHPQFKQGPTFFWLVSFLLLTVIPLSAGVRYPRWAGLVVTGYLSFWSAYFVTLTFHAHTELNALFQVSIIGLYLGWFYGHWVARAALACNLVAVLAASLFRSAPVSHEFSTPVAVVYACFIAVFCLEAGSYLRRRAMRSANYDVLTGVLNRRGLERYGSQAISNAKRDQTPLVLAIVDFDDFKAVNDAGGHAAGDEALRITATTWLQGLGGDDLVARIGGDEFALVIHDDRESANTHLSEIARHAQYSWTWGLTQLRPTDTFDDLLSRADVRMYSAKGNRTVVGDDADAGSVTRPHL